VSSQSNRSDLRSGKALFINMLGQSTNRAVSPASFSKELTNGEEQDAGKEEA